MRAIDDLKAEVIGLAHPAANAFPLMSDDELQGLAEDIRANGLREPLCKDDDGLIVDGRNRWIACQVASVEAKALALPPDIGVVAYVISHNLKRRHLNESQRAMIGAKLATLPKGWQTQKVERPAGSIEPIPRAEAAELLNVSEASIKRARAVTERAAPEIIKAVESGKMAVSKAAEIVRRADRVQAQPLKAAVKQDRPSLRVVEPTPPEHLLRLRLWLHTGARLASEVRGAATALRECSEAGIDLDPDHISDVLSFVGDLASLTKAERAA